MVRGISFKPSYNQINEVQKPQPRQDANTIESSKKIASFIVSTKYNELADKARGFFASVNPEKLGLSDQDVYGTFPKQ